MNLLRSPGVRTAAVSALARDARTPPPALATDPVAPVVTAIRPTRPDAAPEPSEPALARATRLAARLLRCPVALVALADDTAPRLVAAVGVPDPDAVRGDTLSFCARVIAARRPLCVEDATSGSPAFARLAPGVASYAGVPIATREGAVFGALCVLATRPRAWTLEDLEVLADLADAASNELAWQRAARDAEARAREGDAKRAALTASEAALTAMFEASTTGIALGDLMVGPLRANRCLQTLLGYTERELRATTFMALVHPDDAAAGVTEDGAHGAPPSATSGSNLRLRRKDGSWVPCRVGTELIRDAHQRPRFVVTFVEDLTERRAIEERVKASEARLSALVENAGDLIWSVDRDLRLVTSNRAMRAAYRTLFGVELRLGQRIDQYFSDRDRTVWTERCLRVLDGEPIETETHHLAGTIRRDFLVSLSPILVEGDILGVAGVSKDITARKRAEERLARHAEQRCSVALVDSLTGLHNRRGFLALGEQQIKIADRSLRPLALLFIDVDGMRRINDRLGHEEGDRALIDTATVLREAFRDSDVLARVGGDEFVVLAAQASAADVVMLLERLTTLLADHNAGSPRRYPLEISTGSAVYDPARPEPLAELLGRADLKMYAEKRRRLAAHLTG